MICETLASNNQSFVFIKECMLHDSGNFVLFGVVCPAPGTVLDLFVYEISTFRALSIWP